MRFTDEELLTLSEMLTLACWATFWNHKPGADEGVARYDDLLEKILTRLQHNGQGSEVEHDAERQRLRLRKDKEEKSFYAQCYDEMRNETFWEELVARMAERELVKKFGDRHLNSLSDEERKRISEPVSKKYWEEFSRNGIKNLHIVVQREQG
ncbi:hypothetical protein NT6N_05470 [Oceaniferula spumae]|uniref:Uncharacterized protein n=1 Tax=Oceaniferula spumae TaxID=2979115 RepID=A0AAT9FHQ1_9BACT